MSPVRSWITGPSMLWPAGFLMLVSLLVPQRGWAASEARNCTPEPTTNMPMGYGYVLSGSNCVITVADLDSFVFSAAANDQVRIVAVKTGGGTWAVPCVELLDPDHGPVGSTTCSTSVEMNKQLTKTGYYTIVLNVSGNNDTVNYDLSLTRIIPFPGGATTIKYGQVLSDEINPPADSDPFTFFGSLGDLIRITAVKTGGGTWAVLCIDVLQPDSTPLGARLCSTSIQTADITLTQAGRYLILVSVSGNNDVATYNLGVQCLAGSCKTTLSCTLKDVLSYDAATGTLTMNFTAGNQYAVTWNGWLSYQNTVIPLWSTPQPITDPPVPVIKTFSPLSKAGVVGVLSTFTTPKNGITCSSWALVNTGVAGTAADDEAVIETESQ
jgi:hypothetical protein